MTEHELAGLRHYVQYTEMNTRRKSRIQLSQVHPKAGFPHEKTRVKAIQNRRTNFNESKHGIYYSLYISSTYKLHYN